VSTEKQRTRCSPTLALAGALPALWPLC